MGGASLLACLLTIYLARWVGKSGVGIVVVNGVQIGKWNRKAVEVGRENLAVGKYLST